MTLIVFGAVLLGIFTGYTALPPEYLPFMDQVSTLLLGLLIFSVGIDIGSNKGALKDIRSKGKMLVRSPFQSLRAVLWAVLQPDGSLICCEHVPCYFCRLWMVQSIWYSFKEYGFS